MVELIKRVNKMAPKRIYMIVPRRTVRLFHLKKKLFVQNCFKYRHILEPDFGNATRCAQYKGATTFSIMALSIIQLIIMAHHCYAECH